MPAAPVVVTGVPSGAVVSFVEGDSGVPAVGAEVVIDGQTYSTNAQGQIRLTREARFGSLLHVLSPSVLDRLSVVKRDEPTLFLWPRAPEPGLSEGYTAKLVYTSTSENDPLGAGILIRFEPGTSVVAIVLAPELAGDTRAVEQHQEAAAIMTAATGGRIRYALTEVSPPAGVVFEASVDPADGTCENARAFVRWTFGPRGISGGRIVYCRADIARTGTVMHELGHTFGLGHSAGENDVMSTPITRNRRTFLSDREIRVMNLMLLRPYRNRYPDNDRDVGSQGVPTTLGISCL